MARPSYSAGDSVEVQTTDFKTAGRPRVWVRGIVDRVEPLGSGGAMTVVVRTDQASAAGAPWIATGVGPRGGGKDIRPVAPAAQRPACTCDGGHEWPMGGVTPHQPWCGRWSA